VTPTIRRSRTEIWLRLRRRSAPGHVQLHCLWFSMSMEITTYQLASSLIARAWIGSRRCARCCWQPDCACADAAQRARGAKYGIPFPVFIRAPFGVRGANIPAILRAIVACGWFGIQSWIGGTAIHSMLMVIWPSAGSIDGVLWPASSASGC